MGQKFSRDVFNRMDDLSPGQKTVGLRERKRRATLLRIAEIGLGLFAENGYDATTLEAIAEAAGISARTFFYYFKTKDEVLQYWQGGGFIEAIAPALLAQPPGQSPLHAVRDCLLTVIVQNQNEKSVIVDRIFNSSEILRSRKQGFYLTLEHAIFAALCQLWPAAARRAALRMTAMLGVGAFRLAMEARRNDTEPRPITAYITESFLVLETQI
jgi:AcrR family transcriptional regulator